MLRLLFTYNHEILIFEISNKSIRYTDRKWPEGINFIPKDMDFVKKVIMSRNKISNQMIKWINEANTGKEYAEWLACKDDYEVAEVVKRDAKLRGCVFREMFTEEQLKQQEADNSQVQNEQAQSIIEQDGQPIVTESETEESVSEEA